MRSSLPVNVLPNQNWIQPENFDNQDYIYTVRVIITSQAKKMLGQRKLLHRVV